jgi:hypothetical protein
MRVMDLRRRGPFDLADSYAADAETSADPVQGQRHVSVETDLQGQDPSLVLVEG